MVDLSYPETCQGTISWGAKETVLNWHKRLKNLLIAKSVCCDHLKNDSPYIMAKSLMKFIAKAVVPLLWVSIITNIWISFIDKKESLEFNTAQKTWFFFYQRKEN